MTDILQNWVRDIFIVVVGLYFVELVLPEGGMRKYIKFIFSLLILGVVISPLTFLTDPDTFSGETLSQIFEQEDAREAFSRDRSGRENQEDEAERQASALEEVQWIQLEKIYEDKLIKEIEAVLEEKLPQAKVSIEVFLEEHTGEKDFGKVNKIVINTENREYVNNIKKCISDELGIQEDKISVEMPKEGEDG